MSTELNADVMTVRSGLQASTWDLQQQMSILTDLQSQFAIPAKPQEWCSTAEASRLL